MKDSLKLCRNVFPQTFQIYANDEVLDLACNYLDDIEDYILVEAV